MVFKLSKISFYDTPYYMPHIHLSEDFFCDRFWKRERIELQKMKSNEFSVLFAEKF